MIPHDLPFKEVLSLFLDQFLQLFAPELWVNLDRGSLELIEQEAPPIADATHMLRADVVARARMVGETAAFLVHVEHDAQDKRSPAYVFRYFTALRERHRCRVYPIVLLSYEAPRTPRQGLYVETFPDLEVLRFQFRVVQLNRLDWRDYLRSDNPVAAALMSRMHIEPRDRPFVKAACLRNMVRLGLPDEQLRLLAEFPETYLRLDPEGEQVFQQEIQGMEPKERAMIMQTSNQWILKGRADATRQLIARILGKRFSGIPTETTELLDTVSSMDALERLADEALDCPSLEAFEMALRLEMSPG